MWSIYESCWEIKVQRENPSLLFPLGFHDFLHEKHFKCGIFSASFEKKRGKNILPSTVFPHDDTKSRLSIDSPHLLMGCKGGRENVQYGSFTSHLPLNLSLREEFCRRKVLEGKCTVGGNSGGSLHKCRRVLVSLHPLVSTSNFRLGRNGKNSFSFSLMHF